MSGEHCGCVEGGVCAMTYCHVSGREGSTDNVTELINRREDFQLMDIFSWPHYFYQTLEMYQYTTVWYA